MSRTFSFLFALNLFFSGFTLYGQLSDTLQLEEVVVVHSKIPIPLRSTVKPVMVISRETLQHQSGKDLAQVLQEEAGIMVSGAYSNPGKDKSLYIRGAGSEFTVILLDGQPLLDPSGVGGTIDLRLLSLNQFERIEILKGSQSTLYGSDALSGVINLVSKKASAEPISGHFRASFGSLNSYLTQAGLNGSKGKLSYNANINLQGTEGISEAIDQDPTINFDKDGFSQRTAGINIGFVANENLNLKAFGRGQQFFGDFDDGAFSDAPNSYEAILWQTGFTANYRKKNTEAHLNIGHMETDRTFKTAWGTSDFRGFLNQADVWVAFPLREKIKLLAGGNAQLMQMKDPLAVEIDPDASIWSAYTTILLRPTQTLSAEFGYRFNRHSNFGNNNNVTLAFNYRMLEMLSLLGSYTTGFKAPNLSQLYGQYGANPELRPQLSRSLEAGLRYGFSTDPIYLQLTWFQRDISDLVAYDYVRGFFNQSRQEDQGLELDLRMKLSDRLQLSATYTFLDGKVRTPLTETRDTTYNNLFRRPDNQFSFALNFKPGKHWNFDLHWQHTGIRQDLFFNPANFYIAEQVELDAFGLLNFYGSWDVRPNRLRVYLDVKNITNRKFQEVYGFASLPRNFTLGAQWNW